MELKVGMKVVLKDFRYCQEHLSAGCGNGYHINLPNDMKKYFDLPFVTISDFNGEVPEHFLIKESSNHWNFHKDWVDRPYHPIPDELFEI